MLGSLISAGASLIGGVMGRNSQKEAWEAQKEQMMNYTRLRRKAEEAGFNPLVFAGPGAGNANPGFNFQPIMGDAVSRAGAAISDGMSEAVQLRMQKAELEIERQRLEALREEVKLAPNVPGIYRAQNTSRSVPPADGADSGGLGPVRDPNDPRRDTQDRLNSANQPIRLFGVPLYPTGKTTSAETVEEGFGDGLGTLWGAVTGTDLLVGTMDHYLGDPYRKATQGAAGFVREAYRTAKERAKEPPPEKDSPEAKAAREAARRKAMPPWMVIPPGY